MFDSYRELHKKTYGRQEETGVPFAIMLHQTFYRDEDAMKTAQASGDIKVYKGKDGKEFASFESHTVGKEKHKAECSKLGGRKGDQQRPV